MEPGPCHPGVRQLQGEVCILFLAWQLPLGLDFPICIMSWEVSEGLPAQTICVRQLQLNMAETKQNLPHICPILDFELYLARHFPSI